MARGYTVEMPKPSSPANSLAAPPSVDER